jgi:hypothetical protein
MDVAGPRADGADAAGSPVSEPGAVYWHAARSEIARLLSWQDRESFSPTYGCFDRTYWCWKFTDFPGARFQEGVFSLAHLFGAPWSDNALYREPRVLSWIQAGVSFWQRAQRPDGSFDEAYPFEHSLAATAFTGFYVGEAVLRTREVAPGLDGARGAFARAGEWLCRNDERHGVLSNHLAAAAVALHVIFRITGEDRFERRCWQFVTRIYDHQSSEGWYEEYGGADPGYQTQCTFYLARLWQYTGDVALRESLARSLSFLKHCVHPNGTLGGEYGSRNTEFFFPAGCEMLAGAVPEAALIARFMRAWVPAGRMVGPWAMDPQNALPMLNNYLLAADQAIPLEGAAGVALPCETPGEWWFPDAGLLFKSTPSFYAVVGLVKGGVLKIYDKAHGTLAVSDCGYMARLGSGMVASTQSLHRRRQWTRVVGECTIEADFVRVRQRRPTPWLFMALRGFAMTVARSQRVAYWLKNRMVRALTRPGPPVPLRLTRQIRLGTDTVTVTDEIASRTGLHVVECRRQQKFATVHMGSSRYFQWQELDAPPAEAANWAAALTERGHARGEWTWRAGPAGSGA